MRNDKIINNHSSVARADAAIAFATTLEVSNTEYVRLQMRALEDFMVFFDAPGKTLRDRKNWRSNMRSRVESVLNNEIKVGGTVRVDRILRGLKLGDITVVNWLNKYEHQNN